MALVIADRVRETTSSAGTGTLTLTGAFSGFQPFSVIGNGNTTYYCIIDAAAGAWEVGIGTYTSSGNTLSRDTVLSSSNADALVPFAAGLKDVICTQPAERAVYARSAGTGLAVGATAFTANGVPYADSTSTLATSANMTFNGTRLTVADLADSGLTSGRVTYASTGGALVDSANLTFDGTTLTANALTTTNAVTINGGTANGVAYLNGSKVLTTGSALTFDGTNLGVGASPTFYGGQVATAGSIAITGGSLLKLWNTGGTGVGSISSPGTNTLAFGLGGSFTEQMRLTSTGLGIGTSSPRGLLDLNATRSVKAYFGTAGTLGETQQNAGDYVANNLFVSAESAGTMTYTKTTGDNGNAIIQDFSRGITFYTGVTGANTTTGTLNTFERMRLDASGNLGLGVTPSASWFSGSRVFQFGATGALWTNGSNNSAFSHNAVFGDASTTYQTTGAATYYRQFNGGHNWFIAPSGTAGNAITFTQAMTLDASGRLLVGLSSALANGRLQVAGNIGLSGNTQIRQAGDGDGNTLQVFATQLVAGSFNSNAYSYAGGSLVASVGNGDNALLLDVGRVTATNGRVKVTNTTSGDTALSVERNGAFTLFASTAGNVGIGTSSPSASAILDAQSTTRGVRMPNMTSTQKNAIASPAAGLMVFDTTLAKLCVYTGAAWQTITSS